MAEFKPMLPEIFSANDIGRVCRICLLPKQILYSIFENDVDVLLSAVSRFTVAQNDGYPHQICSKCYKDVKIAYCFKKQCEYAHSFVKTVLKLPRSRKTVTCNICLTTFCSNSNLKRHLRNLHDLDWEIGKPRPDARGGTQNTADSISFSEESNIEDEECEVCGEKLEDKFSEHICRSNEQDDTLFVGLIDEKMCVNNSIDHSTLSNSQNKNIDHSLTSTNDEVSKQSNNFKLIKAPTLKDLIFSKVIKKKDNDHILNYLNLMPQDKLAEYKILVEQKKIERKIAYKILKQISRRSQSFLLKNKNRIKLNEDGKFECSDCKKYFESISVLRRHQLSHYSEPKPYMCAICLKLFSQPDYLTYHLKCVHPDTKKERSFQCFICRQSFMGNSELYHHVECCEVEKQLHSNKLSLEEKQQNEFKIFSNNDTIGYSNSNDNSEISHEYAFNPMEKKYSYDSYNSEKYYNSSLYNTHDRNNESYNFQENYFRSKLANESSEYSVENENAKEFLKCLLSGNAINSDVMTKKMEEKERNVNGKFDCELCQKDFNRKAHLRRHYLTHTTVKPYSCEFCNNRFSCPEYVQTHMNRVHHRKISEIASHPEAKSKLTDYELIKYEENNMCNNFGEYPNTQYIVKHKMVLKQTVPKYKPLKTQDGRFQCKFCYKAFSRSEHVRRHEITHSDFPKRFKCEYCTKEFSRADNLKSHIQACSVRNASPDEAKRILKNIKYVQQYAILNKQLPIYKSNLSSSSSIKTYLPQRRNI